jgi:uncharacterized Zn finger protein (UPF0148 family)
MTMHCQKCGSRGGEPEFVRSLVTGFFYCATCNPEVVEINKKHKADFDKFEAEILMLEAERV